MLFSFSVEEGRLFISQSWAQSMPDILDQNQKSSSNDPATTPTQSDQGAGPSSADPITPVTPGSPADAALPAAPVDISDLLRPGADAPKEEKPLGSDAVVSPPSVVAPSDTLPSEPAPAPLSDVALPMDTNLVVPAASAQQSDSSRGAGHSGKPPKLSGRKFGTGGRRNMVIGLALLFLLVSTGLVFVFVNQQQSLNDIRNRASGLLYPVGSSCTLHKSCDSGFCISGKCVQPGGSFLAGTRIQTKDGDRPVETLTAGDELYSFDPVSSEVTSSVVERVISYDSDHYFRLGLENGEVIHVTGRHPIYRGVGYISSQKDELTGATQYPGFEAVYHIKAGDIIYVLKTNANGSRELVESRVQSVEKVQGNVRVYNLQARENPTYFAQGLAVHNKTGVGAPPDTVPMDADGGCPEGYTKEGTVCKLGAPSGGATPTRAPSLAESCYAVNRCSSLGNEFEQQDCRRECQTNAAGTIMLRIVSGVDIDPEDQSPYICKQLCPADDASCPGKCDANSQQTIKDIIASSSDNTLCLGDLVHNGGGSCVQPSSLVCPAGQMYDIKTKKCAAKPAQCAEVKCTSGKGCSLGSNPPAGCFIAHYRCPAGSVQPGTSCDERNGELVGTSVSGSVNLGACGIQQIDIYCPVCGYGEQYGNTASDSFASQFNNTANCSTGGGGGSYSYSQGSYLTGNTPTPTRTPTPTSVVTGTPTPTGGITGTPTPTSIYTPTPTQPGYAYSQSTYQSYSYSQGTYSTGYTPTPTTPLIACNGACTVNADCGGGNVCHNGACRNPSCADDTDCNCNITMAYCNQACTVNTDCGSGLVCLDNVCRNPSCSDSTSCSCGSTVAPTPKVPVAGAPSVIGMTTIVGAVFLLLLGLVL